MGIESRRIAFDPPIAGAIVACAMGSFLLVASVMPHELALIAAQAVLVIVPLGAAILWQRMHPEGSWLRLLGLRTPGVRFALAAVLIGASAWYLNLRLVQALAIRPAPAFDRVLERSSLAMTLVSLAVVPPICEEILFRGVLARGLARGLPTIAAIGLSALLFSFYHLSLVQAAPTFTLGLALAWLTLRSDSIIPAMIVHALNNAIAIVISRDELPGLNAWVGGHPNAMLVICATLTLGGLAPLALGRTP